MPQSIHRLKQQHYQVRDTTRSWMSHDSFMRVTWLILECNMTHVSINRLIVSEASTQCYQVFDMTDLSVWQNSFTWHTSFIPVTWLMSQSLHGLRELPTQYYHLCDMTYSSVSHGSFMSVTWLMSQSIQSLRGLRGNPVACVTWLIYPCDMPHLRDMTHSSVRYDACLNQSTMSCAVLSRMTYSSAWYDCHVQSYHVSYAVLSRMWYDLYVVCMWYDLFICVRRLVRLRDMTHSWAWNDSNICMSWLMPQSVHGLRALRRSIITCVTWLIHSTVWHDSFICVTWLMHKSDLTHSCVWHD